MTPIYIPDLFGAVDAAALHTEVPWIERTEARMECFQSENPMSYTYGSGRGERTYTSVTYTPTVRQVLDKLNEDGSDFNVCFLNLYHHKRQHLGWHADDSPSMDHGHPIAVVSFGAERDIWWRLKGTPGVIPEEQRQLLGHGSLFLMPAGMQRDWEHRIPKSDREVDFRISMTFRRWVPAERLRYAEEFRQGVAAGQSSCGELNDGTWARCSRPEGHADEHAALAPETLEVLHAWPLIN